MIVRSVSFPVPFSPRRDSKRMRIERRGGTLALPIVMDIRMTRMRRRLRRRERVRTLFRVMIFIKSQCKVFDDQLTMTIDNFSMLILY
jgi:hypothetical protein